VHQIRFRPGLCPGPRWRSLQRSPRPLAGLRSLLLRGGEGKEEVGRDRERGNRRERVGMQGKEKRKGGEGRKNEWRGKEGRNRK